MIMMMAEALQAVHHAGLFHPVTQHSMIASQNLTLKEQNNGHGD
jgi:hypothetical protein